MRTSLEDCHVPFFSVTPNKKFFKLFERAGIQNVLISYHYIRQSPEYVENELLPKIRDWGGVFMTDSGAFSFLNDKSFDAASFDWEAYVIEYTDWLMANKEHIFIACNLDVDAFVGHEQVKRWNKEYFKPLEEYMNIAYVAHPTGKAGVDMGMVKEYCKDHDFIAVSEEFSAHAGDIYQMAKRTNTTVHGLAWTKPTILRDYPFFSVDSSSWVNYQKYGATPHWDGTNFQQYDSKNKDVRKTLKRECQKYGVDYKKFCTELDEQGNHNDDEGLTFSLKTWLDVLNDIKKRAKKKLKTTVRDLLEGKAVVFTPVKSKGSLLKMAEETLGAKDIDPNQMQTYEEQEDGSEVAQYKPRTEGRTTLDAFKKKMGSMMFCSTCYVNDKCPMMEKDSACAFDFSDADEQISPIELFDRMIAIQQDRVNRAMYMEQLEGGTPNKVYSQEIAMLTRLAAMKADMFIRAKNAENIGALLGNTNSQQGALPNGEQRALPQGAPSTGGLMGALAAIMINMDDGKKKS